MSVHEQIDPSCVEAEGRTLPEIMVSAREAGGSVLLLEFLDRDGAYWSATALCGPAQSQIDDAKLVQLDKTAEMGLRLVQFRVIQDEAT